MTNALGSRAPALICLNLQRRYARPGTIWHAPRAAAVLGPIQTAMLWARRRGLPVLHIHTIAGGDEPIQGCEPLAREPVYFKREASFFQSQEFSSQYAAPDLSAFIVGFSSARDCLAAANDAERLGARLIFVTDAIAATRLGEFAPDIVDAVVSSLLGEAAGLVTVADLLAREPDFHPFDAIEKQQTDWGAKHHANITKR